MSSACEFFTFFNVDFPSTMTNIRSGTWMMTGNGVMHNGTTTIDDYGQNLDKLKVILIFKNA